MVDLGSEVLPLVRYIRFKGKDIMLKLQSDGSYIDSYKTVYPAIMFDPGYCGLFPIETGKGDPWWKSGVCVNHDKNFAQAKLGYKDSTKDNIDTFKTFSSGIATGMLFGAYQVITGPFYWLIGGVGGLALQTIRDITK